MLNKTREVKSVGKTQKRLSIPMYLSVAFALLLTTLAPLAVADVAQAATLPAYRYTKSFNTASGSVNGRDVASDSKGNVYVTGVFSGTVTFGGSDTYTRTNGDAFLTKFSNNGTYLWTKILDISAASSYASAYGVATDSNDNVYMTGLFSRNVVFGGTDTLNGGTAESAFVTKFNSDGTYAWAKASNATAAGANANGYSVAADNNGNVYISGQFRGSVTFGGSDTFSGGSGNAYVTRYGSDGTYGWTKVLNITASGAYASGEGVAADGSGNVYFTGYFGGTVVFGGTDSVTSSNGSAYITRYGSTGTYGWTKTLNTSVAGTIATGYDVATDSNGNVYATGSFRGNVTFGGVDTMNGNSSSDSYLVKYGNDGTYSWARDFNTSTAGASAIGYGVATDPLGNVYVSGRFQGNVTFGGSDAATSTNINGFLSAFSSSGTYGWTRTFDTSAASASATGYGVAADPLGNVYVGGDFSRSVIFGGIDTLNGNNSSAFVTSYQSFIPATPPAATANSTSSGPTASATASIPGAPVTGFGKSADLNPLVIALLAAAACTTAAGILILQRLKN
jgi:hypothetical protein